MEKQITDSALLVRKREKEGNSPPEGSCPPRKSKPPPTGPLQVWLSGAGWGLRSSSCSPRSPPGPLALLRFMLR